MNAAKEFKNRGRQLDASRLEFELLRLFADETIELDYQWTNAAQGLCQDSALIGCLLGWGAVRAHATIKQSYHLGNHHKAILQLECATKSQSNG